MSIVRLSLLVGCIGLAGCSWFSADEEVQPAELVDIQTERTIDTVMTSSVAGSLGEGFHELRPALLGDRAYLVDADGDLFAINAETGSTIWKQSLETPVIGGVGAGDGKVMVSTLDGRLQVYAALDGAFLWEVKLNAEVLSPAQANDNIVLVQSIDGLLRAYSASEGKPLWSYKADLPALTLRGTSTPILLGNAIFAGFANGKVVAIDPNSGNVAWEARIALPQGKTELERVIDVDGQLLLEAGILYTTSYQGRLVALNASNGAIMWSKDLSSYRSAATSGGQLFTVDAEGSVVAFDKSTGLELWRQEALFLRGLTNPVALSGIVAVADYQGYVHFLATDDGRFVARKQVDSSGVRGPMIEVNNRLFVYGNSGRLSVLVVE